MRYEVITGGFLLLALCGCSCGSGKEDTPEEPLAPTGKDIVSYTTDASAANLFVRSESSFALAPGTSGVVSLTEERLQRIDGFGMAVTQAACYNLLKMSQADRTKFLTEIFSPTDGLGSSLIRVCIGGSDFSLDEFTWCDQEGIENFAVHQSDIDYLFPVLDEILAINPGVKIIGSPWSAPRWMKRAVNSDEDFYSWTSGRLKPSCYTDYAAYFVKWIREMESRGYPIHAITIQNEPLNKGNSMSMYMTWQEQRDFIKEALGPAFRDAGLSTEILLFDHNYNYDGIASQKNYPVNILADAQAAQYVGGTAWHNYGGEVSELTSVYAKYPELDLYFTEASIGTWNHGSFGDNFVSDFRSAFLGVLIRGGNGSVVWNLMLDKEGKPYRPGGCGTCYGAVTIGPSYSYESIVRNTHYYFVAHCSKAIRPGARRVVTSGSAPAGLEFAVFQNPDGSYAAVVLNSSSAVQEMTFRTGSHSVKMLFPSSAITSLTWKD